MPLLTIGITIFVGMHLVPSSPALRASLVGRLGKRRYLALFSGVSLVGLLLIIVGKGTADIVPLWQPPEWGRAAALVITPFAFVLLAAAYLPTNLRRFTANPMLWGVAIWAIAHLLANGDLASLVLFGGLGAFALIAIGSVSRHEAMPLSATQPAGKNLITVLAGLAAYGLFLALHPYLFGAAAID